MIWTGSDDGLVHVTRDGGKTLGQRHAAKDMPEWIQINSIDASPHDAGDGVRRGDDVQVGRLPAVSLQDHRLRQDLEEDRQRHSRKRAFTRVIREDPNRKGLLVAGTEIGLYISFDDGGKLAARSS